jgi:hypothetical protein
MWWKNLRKEGVMDRRKDGGGLLSGGAAIVTAVLFTIAAATSARGAPVVVPNSLASVEGNASLFTPFNLTAINVTTARYQEVFAASNFTALTGGGSITAIAFRPDGASGSAFVAPDVPLRIDLSTTSAAPDAMSTTFANNVGADDTIVRSGDVAMSSAFTGPAGGPKDFDIVITFTTPFFYDPALGNLLLDVRAAAGSRTTPFDAQNSTGDAISIISAFDQNATTGQQSSLGLVAQFTFGAAAPEPPVVCVGLSLLAGFGLFSGRRRGCSHL